MKEIAKKLEEIKDVVYELEGLLELARFRGEKVNELLPIMDRRLGEINTLFSGIKNPEIESITDQESDVVVEDGDEIAEAAEFEEKEDSDIESDLDTVKGDVAEDTIAIKEGPKPAFCINDRFRFRRELFGDSDADFSSAMDLVATMDNYEEAEEYFIEELGWDSEDPNVADFLAIIERYFTR